MALLLASASAGQLVHTRDDPPTTPKLEGLEPAASVAQHGITWTFDRKARVGRFVNGDWYVVGPATITAIEPKPLWGDEVKDPVDKEAIHESRYKGKTARNGSTLNLPAVAPRAKGGKDYLGAGFDSRIPSGRYDPDQFAHLPIALKPGDSLVSTISRAKIERFSGQHAAPVGTAAVLTCVAEPQPPDAFRPSFCETRTCKAYLARDLRREMLLKLPRVPSAPKLPTLAEKFQRPWVDTVDFCFAVPNDNMPHYGQQIAEDVGDASLALLLDYAPEGKEPLLRNMVQVAIDQWGAVRGGRSWGAFGGHNSGRKWLIVLAGLLLDDKEMQSPTTACPNAHFQEDDQTAFCPVEHQGKRYEKGWTGATVVFTGHTGLGAKEKRYGPLELFPPSEWPMPSTGPGSLPASEAYRRANTSAAWVGEALAARMLHVEQVWNHDPFFAYVDRWMCEDDTPFNEEIRKAGLQDYSKVRPRDFGRQGFCWSRFAAEMWTKYRNNLPPSADGHQDPPAESWNGQAAKARK